MVECEAELQAGPACSPSRGTAHTLVGPMSRTKPFSALCREDPPLFSGQGTMSHRLPSCLSRVRLVLCWGHARGKKPRPPVPVPAIWEAMHQGSQAGQPRAGWALPPLPSMPPHHGPICCQVQTKGAWNSGTPLSLNSLRKPGGGGQVGLPCFRRVGQRNSSKEGSRVGTGRRTDCKRLSPRQWPGSCWTQCSRPGRAPTARFTSLVLAHSQNEMLHTRAQCPGSASPRPVTVTAHPG